MTGAEAAVRRLIDCFNTRRFDDAVALYAPGFTSHPFGTGASEGAAAWRALVDRYPHLQLDVEDVIVAGDRVVVRCTVRNSGTTFAGHDPVLIEVFRVADGRLAEWWGSTWLPDLG